MLRHCVCVCVCVLGLELRSSARAALLLTAESSLQSDFIRGWLGAVLLGVVLHSQGLRTFHGSETIPLLSALIWKVTGVTRRRHCDDRAGTELLGMHSACVFFFSRICVCVCGGGGHLARVSSLLPHGSQRTQVVRVVVSAHGHQAVFQACFLSV